jgi:HEAT repeat-containing taxis protein
MMTDGPDESGTIDKEARRAYYLARLADDSPGNRWNAALSLGRLGDGRGVEPLISALADEDERVRLKVIWALGAIGDPRATAPLRALYRTADDETRDIIREALEAISQNTSEQ